VLVHAGDVAGELQKALTHNSENDRARYSVQRGADAIAGMEQNVQRLRADLQKAEAAIRDAVTDQQALAQRVALMVDIDVSSIRQRAQDVDRINGLVRANLQRAEVAKEADAKKARSEDLTRQIDGIKQRKAETIEKAAMPVAGLGLSDGGVTLGGLPLDQASAAEQLRVSVAIGLAMNPRLRVLLIRDASLLDADSLRLVAEMAQAADAQVWCEMVTDGSGVGIVIEDGMVKEQAEATA
jgi:hypothetical protein